MGKPAFQRWVRGVVVAAVGMAALAGCEGVPRLSPAPPSLPEQRPQAIACGLSCGFGHCVVKNGAPACDCPVGSSGARCEGCAGGYQDLDGDGVCLPDCSMMPGLQCGHGVCSTAVGVPACACDEGFAGARCEACAPGFQDHDGDGRCTADCSSATVECHGHGVCSDRSGTVACACEPGFAASDCSDCAAGFQDRDGDGLCAPDCASASPGCGSQGACDDASGVAVCACVHGTTGVHCDRCAAGFQDEDGDGVCRPDCASAGLQCAVGACSSAQGIARCECTGGYVGEQCDRCAPGLQDRDFDGVCVPSCESGALSCDPYLVCDDASGQPQCVCLPGYVRQGDGCALSPLVEDPTFSASRWTPLGGALPGLIPAAAVCHGAAQLVSDLSLPPVSSPDAFAVTSFVVTPGDSFFPSESRALARVGESMAWLGASAVGTGTLACLGEGAQVGQTSFQLSSASLSSLACDPFTNAELRFQQVDVVAAPGCPRPGTVLDGHFDLGAWALAGEATVTLMESTALRMQMTDQCSAPRASTVMSVPRSSSLPSPAVRFKMWGDAGRDVVVSVGLVGPGGRALHANRLRVVAQGGPEIVTRCLPSWTAGSAVALELSMRGNGACAEADGRQFFFDDFELVSEPSCVASTAGLLDPSFEADLEHHWEVAAGSGGLSDSPEAGRVMVGAHSGTGALRLSNARPCLSASARQGSRVPEGVVGAGPAVVGWYRAELLEHSTAALSATVLGAGYELALPVSAGWARSVLCLPRELAGLPVSIEARQVAEQGMCDAVFPREEIFFDDLEVTTDPSCP